MFFLFRNQIKHVEGDEIKSKQSSKRDRTLPGQHVDGIASKLLDYQHCIHRKVFANIDFDFFLEQFAKQLYYKSIVTFHPVFLYHIAYQKKNKKGVIPRMWDKIPKHCDKETLQIFNKTTSLDRSSDFKKN